MFGPWRQYSLISVNKISDAVQKNCLKKWCNFDVGEQPITIKLCVFVMEMANKHDGKLYKQQHKNYQLVCYQFTSGRVDFWMLDRSSKMINGGGRALVLHSQRMNMVSYVQPVIREPADSWHISAFDSWIHIIKMYRYPRTLCGITLKHG